LHLAPETEAGDAEGPNGTKVIKTVAHPPAAAEMAKHFPQLELLDCLGRGGMGVVYKARQPRLDRLVALKILAPEREGDPKFAERFAREAKVLASLNHSNIVAIYDFGQSEGLYYFIMEFVDGVSVRQLLRQRQMAPEEALAIVPKICEALQYAHEQGIVHRDIKPENVLLDKQGRVKIADFGIAKIVGGEAQPLQTEDGLVFGTPRYMAPEQFEKPETVDHRADIYSLGVVFYEMLTGSPPMGRFPLPSEKQKVDRRVDEVVLKALEKAPDRRYQHASEVKTDVETISGIIERLPPKLQRAFGYEYRSKTTIFGVPLMHINAGFDPVTGERRVAKGILALGDRAYGVIALGRTALGGIACGGFSAGLVAVGGCSTGLITAGGIGLALLLSFAGISVAPVALGGLAVGYYSMGGVALGPHALSRYGQDPLAEKFFASQGRIFPRMLLLSGTIVACGFATSWFLPRLMAWRSKSKYRSG